MKIVAKSFPKKEQIQGRIDSRAFDGIELFVLPSILDNPKEHEEAVKLARDNFPIVNLETMWYVEINGKQCIAGILDSDSKIADKTKRLLESAVRLNDGKGIVTTHFVGCPITADKSLRVLSQEERIERTGRYFQQYLPFVSLENINAYDSLDLGGIYRGGCDISDFLEIYRRFGIPTTLDIAHLAICLQQYALSASGKKLFSTDFLPRQIELGERVLEKGLMKVWFEEVEKLPPKAIVNSHLNNVKVDGDGTYHHGYNEFTPENSRILDLDTTIQWMIKRGCEYAVTETDELNYSANPDWDAVPKMTAMAREIRKLNV